MDLLRNIRKTKQSVYIEAIISIIQQTPYTSSQKAYTSFQHSYPSKALGLQKLSIT